MCSKFPVLKSPVLCWTRLLYRITRLTWSLHQNGGIMGGLSNTQAGLVSRSLLRRGFIFALREALKKEPPLECMRLKPEFYFFWRLNKNRPAWSGFQFTAWRATTGVLRMDRGSQRGSTGGTGREHESWFLLLSIWRHISVTTALPSTPLKPTPARKRCITARLPLLL